MLLRHFLTRQVVLKRAILSRSENIMAVVEMTAASDMYLRRAYPSSMWGTGGANVPSNLYMLQSPSHQGSPLSNENHRVPLPSYISRRSFAVKAQAGRRSAGSSLSTTGSSPPGDDDRERKFKALKEAMAEINKNYGKGTVGFVDNYHYSTHVETMSTGILPLDIILGGGLPQGRIVELYGPESSGKTTVALHALAAAQKRGDIAGFIDAEHAFDRDYARRLGVDTANLGFCQPISGDNALEIADSFIRTGAVKLVVVDSVSALVPRAEIESEIGNPQIGGLARMMSVALRKLAGNAAKSGCTVLFINQIRNKIGVLPNQNPETTSGGNALKFFASLRLEVRGSGGKIVHKGEDIGIRCKAKVTKSKVSKPYRKAAFDMIFGQGVPNVNCIVDCAEAGNLLKKNGSWYQYQDVNVQGKEKLVQYLKENPTMANELEQQIRQRLAEDVAREREGDTSTHFSENIATPVESDEEEEEEEEEELFEDEDGAVSVRRLVASSSQSSTALSPLSPV